MKDNIKIDGYKGTWYVIYQSTVQGKEYFLLESEVYGDEAPCLIVDGNYQVILDDVWDGFNDLYAYMGI